MMFGDFLILGIIWFMGGLVTLQALYRKKGGENLWAVYNEVAKELSLSMKEETTIGYGLPDIFGNIENKRIFIHPIVGKGMGGVAKTAFAVEHGMKINGRIMIIHSGASKLRVGRYKHTLELPYHPTFSNDYIITSQSKNNQEIVNRIFSSDVCDDFRKINSKFPKSFFGLIMESGIALYYTFGWETEKEQLKNTILSLYQLVKKMESKADYLNPNINNRLFKYTTKKGMSKQVDVALSGILVGLGILVVILGGLDVKNLWNTFMIGNLGAVIILMGTTRIYAATKMKK